MIIKKKAILHGIKFTRVLWKFNPPITSNICQDCNCFFKDIDVRARLLSDRPDPCEVCGLVHHKTKTSSIVVGYGYIVKKIR